ncbi:MAG: hypothetical protein FWJ93_09685 [Micromonosporaceae bacterium]
MERRTLDILFSSGGLLLAGLLLVIGFVLTSNANVAKTSVREQLGQQDITFPAVDQLTAEERQAECLVRYAGDRLTTGKQAECYANHYLSLQLKSIADGQTYADLGEPQTQLRAQVAQAAQNNDPALADLQEQLAEVTAQRETILKGETLRGLLLTSYGLSELGTKAEHGATVAYLAAGLLALLATAGLGHAFVTSATRRLAVPEPAREPEDAESRG